MNYLMLGLYIMALPGIVIAELMFGIIIWIEEKLNNWNTKE